MFAGQRAEGFYVDLGAVFDLGDLRGFAGDHAGGPAAGLMNGMPGVNSTADVNVHTLALQIPVEPAHPCRRRPDPATRPRSSACGPRRAASGSGCGATGSTEATSGAARGRRCRGSATRWPTSSSSASATRTCGTRSRRRRTAAEFLNYFAQPLLAAAAAVACTPDVFPNLAAYNSGSANTRPDIEAIFLTGIPAGVITQAPTFTNYNGTGVKADMLRLNTAIPPSSSPNSLGLLGLDVAGWPNGRRVFDDVATIALRAVAGATLGFVVPTFTADGAAGVVDFGLTTGGTSISRPRAPRTT